MPFDFKKEDVSYRAKTTPQILMLPETNFLTVEGRGDPNAPDGLYQRAVKQLFTVAYTLKMSRKNGYEIPGFFDYVAPPLESFWWQKDLADYQDKNRFYWIAALRLPDFVTRVDLDWAIQTVQKKKKLDCSAVGFQPVQEGLCVQSLHIGPYDSEPETLARMDAFLAEKGYENDLQNGRLHHEIYLSNPQRVPPEKQKTILRHPIRPKSSK